VLVRSPVATSYTTCPTSSPPELWTFGPHRQWPSSASLVAATSAMVLPRVIPSAVLIPSGGYTVGDSRAMAPVVGLESPRHVTVATRGTTQLANYMCGVALGVGWAFVRPCPSPKEKRVEEGNPHLSGPLLASYCVLSASTRCSNVLPSLIGSLSYV
jgi:hypothetical protein